MVATPLCIPKRKGLTINPRSARDCALRLQSPPRIFTLRQSERMDDCHSVNGRLRERAVSLVTRYGQVGNSKADETSKLLNTGQIQSIALWRSGVNGRYVGMRTVVVTGGAGFLGSLLVSRLVEQGLHVINVDLQPSPLVHPALESYQADIRDRWTGADFFDRADRYRVSLRGDAGAWVHRSSHAVELERGRDARSCASGPARRVGRLIYTSSNCLWGESFGRPVREDDEPHPVETYGLRNGRARKRSRDSRATCRSLRSAAPPLSTKGGWAS